MKDRLKTNIACSAKKFSDDLFAFDRKHSLKNDRNAYIAIPIKVGIWKLGITAIFKCYRRNSQGLAFYHSLSSHRHRRK
ncbi:hypothetical protein HMPREF2954_01625 [Neisseria sp. HMSC067H09]|nr:hypothetical protein HMPREF3156_02732 [Neisseria sp. HMSC06F02]OFS04295.1 hypothetical protein HMPREF2954_01625 [Neisseria sp. HMSC067H09]